MRNLVFTCAFCAVLAGCLGESDAVKTEALAAPEVARVEDREPPPAVDSTSPDNALKSYWSVVDWRKRISKQQHEETLQSKLTASMDDAHSKVAVPAIYKRRSYPLETFDREIIEAKVETDTRATIHAVIKNSTPIPEGADVTNYDRKRREQGDRYRYVMERGQDGWRVAEIWEFDRYYDKKWSKTSPSSTKPSVGTLTFGGN